MCKYIHISVLCAFFTCYVNSQMKEGTPCQTSKNQRGSCMSIYDCELVKVILSGSTGLTAEIREYVRGLSCGRKNNIHLVCCPQSVRNVSPDESLNTEIGEETGESEQFLLPPACGASNATLPKVVGGIPAKLGEFPWIVALGYQNRKSPTQPKWLCGGALITYKHVITAAHCVHKRTDLYIARMGELDLYDDNDGAQPTDIPIIGVKVHENFDKRQMVNDIAIVTLKRSTENLVGVWPICLPWESDKRTKSYIGNNPFVAGWGALNFNGPRSSTLQLATIPVIDNNFCAVPYQNKTKIDETIICVGYEEGEIDACQGDSGGPLMYGKIQPREKNIRFYLIGIVSYGFRCAEKGYPGVYTRVTHFLNWIGDNIA